MGLGRFRQGVAHLDIAEACLRGGGTDAESHDTAGSGDLRGGQQGGAKFRGVGDLVVGGHHADDGLRVILRQQQRGGGDGGGAVAADGLEQDTGAFDVGVPHLLGDQEPVGLVADDEGRREFAAGRAERRFLDQGSVGDERPELLGEAFARDRPEASAGAAGEDDRNDASGGAPGLGQAAGGEIGRDIGGHGGPASLGRAVSGLKSSRVAERWR